MNLYLAILDPGLEDTPGPVTVLLVASLAPQVEPALNRLGPLQALCHAGIHPDVFSRWEVVHFSRQTFNHARIALVTDKLSQIIIKQVMRHLSWTLHARVACPDHTGLYETALCKHMACMGSWLPLQHGRKWAACLQLATCIAA